MRIRFFPSFPRQDRLFLPMRGYESLTLMEYLTEITLFLPMRGYEIINIRIDIRTVLVISPHEGL